MNSYKRLAYLNVSERYSDRPKARVVNMERAIELVWLSQFAPNIDVCYMVF